MWPRMLLFLGLATATSGGALPSGVAVLTHDELMADGQVMADAIRLAFAGDASYGLVIIKDIPGFREARRAAFNSTIQAARAPPPHSRRPRSTWPGLRSEEHIDDPLQGAFLHNMLEDVGPTRVDPVFGKTPWPNAAFKDNVVATNRLIWSVTNAVLAGTDRLVEEEARRAGVQPPEVPLGRMLHSSDFLYSLMKIYRSEFSRGDDLFDDLDELRNVTSPEQAPSVQVPFAPQVGSPITTAEPAAELSSMRTHSASSRKTMAPATTVSTCSAEPAAELSSMRTHSASSRKTMAPATTVSTCSAEPAAELSSMRTHSASSRAGPKTHQPLGASTPTDEVEPYWLPWHIDPNTISTLTGDAFFDFNTATTLPMPEYPDTGLGLLALNSLGERVHLSQHIDDSSLVVMMAAGAQVHTGGLLRGCMHAVKRQAAPPGASRIMYYQAWYGPAAKRIAPPNGSDYHPSRTTAPDASDEVGRRVRSIVDPIVNSVYGRTQRTMLHDFRRQFQRMPLGSERDGTQAHFEALNAVLPLGAAPPAMTIDVITDLSCPLAYLGLKRLRAALDALGLAEPHVRLRFHAVFINPHMDADGEDMATYMMRRRNLTLDAYNDDAYPLNAAAFALNYSYAKERRVINPRRAHLVARAAGEDNHAHAYESLARRYFEDGEDIGDLDVLLRINADLGHEGDELMLRRAMDRAEGGLMRTYRALDPLVDGVPHFLIREGVYGSGLELHGPVEVDTFAEALQHVHDARFDPPFGDSFGLQQPAGMVLPGFGGTPTLVPPVDRLGGPSISDVNLKGWAGPEAWPYEPADFTRQDESDDGIKYAKPNFGTHIDAPALRALSETYAAFFDSAALGFDAAERHGNLELLDIASSWISHYPPLPNTTHVSLHGLNAEELAANTIAHRRDVANLNQQPELPYEDGAFDFVTMAASVGYLTRPREIFSEMHRVLKPGGVVIVSFTNRVFDEKATKVWLDHMDEEVALCSIVRDYFHFGPVGGWHNVSSADISPHPTRGDPMWIVTAVKA